MDSREGLKQHNIQTYPSHCRWYCAPCDRAFASESNLHHHLRSSTHQPRRFKCPGKRCGATFISHSALVLHCESGTCPSGVTRDKLNKLIVSVDKGSIITNPARMVGGPDEGVTQRFATEYSWNGEAYECFLCFKEFRSLKALNLHLNSPAHEGKIYKCPTQWDGCRMEFRTLGGLVQHMESGSCKVSRYARNLTDVIDALSSKMRTLGI